MRVYLASPLGFAASTRAFMESLETLLSGLGFAVWNPWHNPLGAEYEQARAMPDAARRWGELRRINAAIARANERAILDADLVVAVLDGVDVDSGTASEIGFAYARSKPVFGLRTDFRQAGENEAATVNLQVEYWIEASGGRVVRSTEELGDALRQWRDTHHVPGTMRSPE